MSRALARILACLALCASAAAQDVKNAKAYNLCSQMPRLGYSGTLTEQQIRDLVGLLLDPASPVNQ